MATVFDTIDKGLKRTVEVIPANTQYVTTTFWVYFNAWPTSGAIRTFYMVSNSAARNTESIAIVQDSTGKIYLTVGTTSYGGQVFLPGWHSIGLRRRATVDFLDMDVDDDSSPVSTATIAFGGWTFNEMYLGTDPRIPTGGVTHQVVYFREWTAFLDYRAEWSNPTPSQTTQLETDTPLHADLLDTTDNNHDWIHVGGGSTAFTSIPDTRTGSMGGWWSISGIKTPFNGNTYHDGFLIVRSGYTNIASFQYCADGFTTELGIYTEVNDRLILRYTGASGNVELTIPSPITDPAVGTGGGGSRFSLSLPWRFAIAWKCSTYDEATSTYAADGFVKSYVNGALSMNAVNVVIPIRPTNIEYLIGMGTDTDRHWARVVPDIPATNGQGAFTGGTPSGLIYFEEFDGGSYTGWTRCELYAPGGGSAPIPNVYSNCGGDGGYGLSIYAVDPYGGGSGLYAPYVGLSRLEKFPPISLVPGGGGEPPDPPEPPEEPPDGGGIYQIPPSSSGGTPTGTHDIYYNRAGGLGTAIDKKIPNPTIKTALIGE